MGSTAPSELMDPIDRDTDFTNSQEEMNLDPGLGSVVSPKRSHSDMGNGGVAYHKPLPTTAENPASEDLRSVSDVALLRVHDAILPNKLPNLVSMASSSSNSASGTSISLGGGEE